MSDMQKEEKLRGLLKIAYDKIKTLEKEVKSSNISDPIAVIGMACRLPGGAVNPDQFWEVLENGIDAIQEIPSDRWDVNRLYDPKPGVSGKMYTKYGAFIDNIDKFDASFFEISPKEAKSLDPQQRLLLEVSYEAFENAGLNMNNLKGSNTGVFIGTSGSDYERIISKTDLENIEGYFGTGTAPYTACGRLSYFYDFFAPSVAINTACSSSLVGLHYALLSLNSGESDLAVVGGSQVILSPEPFLVFCKLNALSPDGRSRAFSGNAEGYGRGEGCCVLLLKRLSDARRDNDIIHAVIRGVSVGNDGRSSGLTAPNDIAQVSMITKAMQMAGVSPSDIDYVETHGTGTTLGDPIEFEALSKVFYARRNKLLIGTVKSNIAHLEGTAGIAGLLKVILSLKNKSIPPSLHSEPLNPHIAWNKFPIEVAKTLTPWKANGKPRIAGVSSFGVAGTGAHVIVEEAPDNEMKQTKFDKDYHVLTLSAKTEEALKQMITDFNTYIKTTGNELKDICFTSNISRTAHDFKEAFVADSKKDLSAKMTQYLNKNRRIESTLNNNLKVVFLFTGQGSYYFEMGKALFETSHIFSDELKRCDILFQEYIDKSITEILYSGKYDESLLSQALYTQPIIFSIEYALTKLWKSWGVEPYIVVGHSIGEYAAACAAGILTLEDAVKIVAARGKLMQSIEESGKMIGVLAGEEKVIPFLEDYKDSVSIAVINTDESVTLSGKSASIDEIQKKLKSARIFTEPLNISHAFHSVLMEPYVSSFKEVIEGITFSKPKIPIISSIHGKRAKDEMCTPDYWASHISKTVRFFDCLKVLESEGYQLFIEIGGDATLSGITGQYITDTKAAFMPSLRPGNAWMQILLSAADLHRHGYVINWEELNKPFEVNKEILPNYPFQKESFWITELNTGYFDYLHSLDWEEDALDSHEYPINVTDKVYYIFSDKNGVGEKLNKLLSKSGANCFMISESSISMDSIDEFRELFTNTWEDSFKDVNILYLWGMDSVETDKTSVDQIMAEQKISCTGLLNIIQATFHEQLHEKIKCWIITKNANWIDGVSEKISVSQSTLWGFGRELDIEVGDIYGGIIDIDDSIIESHINLIPKEIEYGNQDQVALRKNGRRFVPRANTMNIEKKQPTLALNPEKTYFITGGLGALGLIFTEWMIGRGARNMVLNGRRPPKPEALETIHWLNAKGAQIITLCGDVAVEEDVKRMFKEIEETMPPLGGVFHAAGINHFELIINKTWEHFNETFQSKVRGTWNLHKATENLDLDYFVMFTSAASIMGISGLSDYVAGNCFINAMGKYRSSKNLPVISLNWGLWAQAGMAVDAEKDFTNLTSIGVYGTQPPDGLKQMELILCKNIQEPIIMVVDWSKYKEFMPIKQRHGIFAHLCEATDTAGDEEVIDNHILEELKLAKPMERRRILIRYIQKSVAQVMGFNEEQYEKIIIDKALMEQGIDSLMSLQFRNMLNKMINANLSATLFFNYPTVIAVADHLLEEVLDLDQEDTIDDNTEKYDVINDLEKMLEDVEIYKS